MTSYTKNIVTDYSAPTDDTTDASTAWNSFTTFLTGLAAGDDVTLTVPAHRYKFKGAGAVDMAPGILGGITLVLNDAGAIYDGNSGGGFFLNAAHLAADPDHSSRIASVGVGATSVTLLTPSEHTRYVVDQWIAVTGIDLQGFGQPPNPAFYEYRKITANAGTGVISFSDPLVQPYLSTWPLYFAGSEGEPDLGGPATIYAMPYNWDIDVTFNGSTIDQSSQQTYFKGRKGTFNGGGVATNGSNVIATLNQSITFNDFDQHLVTIEVDKMVETVVVNGGTVNQWQFQSMCPVNFTATNATANTYNGTPRNLIILGGSIGSLQVGAFAYGRTDSLNVSGATVPAISVNPVVDTDVTALFTMSNGVISSEDALNGPVRWAVPGTNMVFKGQYNFEGSPFRVVDVTQDNGFTRIRTTLSGGWPTLPLSAGKLALVAHPCPNFTMRSTVGCANVEDLSGAPAGRPIWSYSNRTYTKATAQVVVPVWGALVSIKETVSAAYSGAQSPAFDLAGDGSPFIINSSGAAAQWNTAINPKVPGERDQFPASHNGTQSGDDLIDPGVGTYLLNNQIIPRFTTDLSDGDATVTIEIITDQSILPTSVVPLRLRLHA